MLKIHQLFLRTYIAIFAAILITLTLVTYFWAKNLYLNQIEKNLIQNIDTLSIVLNETQDIHNITNIVKSLRTELNLRITIIIKNIAALLFLLLLLSLLLFPENKAE